MDSLSKSQNISAIIDIHAETRGNHPAILFENIIWSYLDLAKHVKCQASAFSQNGVGCGDLVGLCMKDSADHVAAMFALARIGAIMLPMDNRWGLDEKKRLINHFKPKIVIADDPEHLENVRTVKSDTFLQQAKEASPKSAPEPINADDLPLLISLSSGTTGRPKGPAITHQQMINRFINQAVSLSFDWYDRFLVATPLYFGGGRTFALSYLYLGGTIVLFPPPYKPKELVDAMKMFQPSSLFLVPTLLRRVLSLEDHDLRPFSNLRVLISSGAPIFSEECAEVCARLTPNFFEYYASTEGGGITVLAPNDRSSHETSVGRAAFRVEIQVVNDEHEPVAAGEVGKIRYRGPGVANSFFRDEDSNSESFREGWFYPGDLGELNREGFLYLRGRSKDMIIRGGANIYPIEVEQTISQIKGVRDVAVVGVPDNEMGEEIVAVLVANNQITEEKILGHCQNRLAAYKIPRRIQFVNELPRNSSGKILKSKIVEALSMT